MEDNFLLCSLYAHVTFFIKEIAHLIKKYYLNSPFKKTTSRNLFLNLCIDFFFNIGLENCFAWRREGGEDLLIKNILFSLFHMYILQFKKRY